MNEYLAAFLERAVPQGILQLGQLTALPGPFPLFHGALHIELEYILAYIRGIL